MVLMNIFAGGKGDADIDDSQESSIDICTYYHM